MIKDFTLLPEGELFGYVYLPPFDTTYCYNFQLVDEIGSQGTYNFSPISDQNQNITGITCDSTGTIYSAGTGIATYSGTGASTTYLGDLPPDMHCLGDLTFRQGRLYMAAMGNRLVEVNLQNPAASTVFMDFPPGTFPIHGLATFNYACDSVETYAIGKIDTLSRIYQIDFENKTLTLVCETELTIIGAATDSECSPPPYTLRVDADENNSSGALGFDFFADTICLPPSPIVDADVELISCRGGVDSILIMLSGILDAGQEYLDISGSGINIQITGSGTPEITLINNGNADNVDFQNLLRNIRYWNNAAPNLSFGTRKITIIAREEVFQSDTATAFITLDNSMLTIAADVTEPDCFGEANGSLFVSGAGGQPPFSFVWDDGQAGNFIVGLGAGNYHLTITDALGCEKTDSIFLPQPDSLITQIEYAGPPAICDNSANLMASAVGGTAGAGYSFLWNNGVAGATNAGLGAGDYSVTVTDSRDCVAEANLTIAAGDTVLVFQKETLCEGAVFQFQGEEFKTDTSFCLVYILDNGCDSTLCLDIEFSDTVLVKNAVGICKGESIEFEGNLISTDSTVCITQAGVNGCDSTVCFEVRILEFITPLSDAFCEGDTYVFAGETLTEAGVYFDTLTNENGCDSVLALNLEKLPAPAIVFSTSGSLCEGGEVQISGGQHETYQWSDGSQSESITVNNPGNFSLTATGANGCPASDSIDIQEVNLEVSFLAFDPDCFGEANGEIVVEAVEGGSSPYLFSLNGKPAQTESSFLNLEAGAFELTVSDMEGCRESVEIMLEEPPEIFLDAGDDQTIKLGEAIELSVFTNLSNPVVSWLPSDGLNCDTCLTVLASPVQTTGYEILVSDERGCFVLDALTIKVENRSGIFIPNAFSPNGDGINDHWTVFADASISSILSLQVFDRWGSLIFEITDILPNDPNAGWDGDFNGKAMPKGVYVYVVKLQRIDGAIETEGGDVVLLR